MVPKRITVIFLVKLNVNFQKPSKVTFAFPSVINRSDLLLHLLGAVLDLEGVGQQGVGIRLVTRRHVLLQVLQERDQTGVSTTNTNEYQHSKVQHVLQVLQ